MALGSSVVVRRGALLALLASACLVAVACGLNPQPIPPDDLDGNGDTAGEASSDPDSGGVRGPEDNASSSGAASSGGGGSTSSGGSSGENLNDGGDDAGDPDAGDAGDEDGGDADAGDRDGGDSDAGDEG